MVLLVVSPERKWDLMRSVTAGYAASLAARESAIKEGLIEERHQSPGAECICNVRDTFTYSPYDFFGAITADVLHDWSFIVAAERPTPAVVPFISRAAIDDQCTTIHDAIHHTEMARFRLTRSANGNQSLAGLRLSGT